MKSAYEWIISEETEELLEERGSATKKFARMVQMDALEACMALLNAKIAEYTHEHLTSRECDICAKLGEAMREIKDLRDEIQEDQDNEDGHE